MNPYYDTRNEPDFFEEQQYPVTKRSIPAIDVLLEQFRKLATIQNRIDNLKERLVNLPDDTPYKDKKDLYEAIALQRSYLGKEAQNSDEVALITLAHYITQKKNEQDVSASYLKDYMEKQRNMYSHLNSNINQL